MGLLNYLTKFENFGLLLLRTATGLFMSFLHGWGKISGLFNNLFHGDEWRFVNSVESIGFPTPFFFAIISTLTEFIGGILAALGLYTRIAVFFLVINMSVAVYRHLTSDMRFELAALFLFIFIYFLIKGGGRYSLDNYLGIERTR